MYEYLLNGTPVRIWAKSVDPYAYKNIDEVMANQADLVKIVTALSPIAVIKGL